MQHVPPPIRVTHTFPRTNLSHPICGLSPSMLLSGSSWKQVTPVASQGPSLQHEDFQQMILTSRRTSVFLKLFWLYLLFLQSNRLLPPGMLLSLFFSLCRQEIVFHFLLKTTAPMMSSSHMPPPVKPLTHCCKLCLSLGPIHVHF